MAGSPHRNLHMFGALCGTDAAKKVILVSTMWDKLKSETEIDRGYQRERELKERFWSPMTRYGTRVMRFDNRIESAWEIITSIIEDWRKENNSQQLLIQEELVDLGRAMEETAAATAVYSQYQTLLSEHKQALEQLQRAARTSSNKNMLGSLEAEKKQLQYELEVLNEQARKLGVPLTRRVMKFFSKRAKAVSLHRPYLHVNFCH